MILIRYSVGLTVGYGTKIRLLRLKLNQNFGGFPFLVE